MPIADINGLKICYRIDGPEDGTPLLLIMGLAAQYIAWPEPFVAGLTERGFRVIRFDNRDVGRSSKLTGVRPPPIKRSVARWAVGLPVKAPYTLSDMATDAQCLLDHLSVETACVAGVSMGGMIAQQLAIQAPHRVCALTSIMSHPGSRRAMVGKPAALKALLGRRPPRTRDEAGAAMANVFEVIGSPGRVDRPAMEELGRRAFDRGTDPRGSLRQMAAILAATDRRKGLKQLKIPVSVVHGSADPLIPFIGGRQTAQAVPGATFELIDGLGHDLNAAFFDRFWQAIERVAVRAAQAA